MKIEYKHNEETFKTKEHTDIILNGEDIGYYVFNDKEYTCFIELNGEIYVEDFESEDDLKTNIKYFLEQC
jgi:hypothetical protein